MNKRHHSHSRIKTPWQGGGEIVLATTTAKASGYGSIQLLGVAAGAYAVTAFTTGDVLGAGIGAVVAIGAQFAYEKL